MRHGALGGANSRYQALPGSSGAGHGGLPRTFMEYIYISSRDRWEISQTFSHFELVFWAASKKCGARWVSRPGAEGLEGEVLLGVGAREGSILARVRGPSNVGRKSHRVTG